MTHAFPHKIFGKINMKQNQMPQTCSGEENRRTRKGKREVERMRRSNAQREGRTERINMGTRFSHILFLNFGRFYFAFGFLLAFGNLNLLVNVLCLLCMYTTFTLLLTPSLSSSVTSRCVFVSLPLSRSFSCPSLRILTLKHHHPRHPRLPSPTRTKKASACSTKKPTSMFPHHFSPPYPHPLLPSHPASPAPAAPPTPAGQS